MTIWDIYQCQDGECAWEGDYRELEREPEYKPPLVSGDELGAYACPVCGGPVEKTISSDL